MTRSSVLLFMLLAAGFLAAQPTAVTPDPNGRRPIDALDSVWVEELTWMEVRDALKAGKTTVIVPTGGTEKNGYHMVIGKHNFIVAYAANQMARKLKNTLVAPILQYVPEGDPDKQVPGAISVPSPAYDMILDAAARSLRVHGFKEILFIGDDAMNDHAGAIGAGLTALLLDPSERSQLPPRDRIRDLAELLR